MMMLSHLFSDIFYSDFILLVLLLRRDRLGTVSVFAS